MNSSRCPLCGVDTPHEHSPLEQVIFNNGRKSANLHPPKDSTEPTVSILESVASKDSISVKRDAERYRYLKTDSNMQFNMYNRLEIDEIDEAIDNAIKESS